ncbi:Uncharacterized conserved protein YbaA, DUF1428 family [Colwellia chukchiensis]|uniref:Uncharacterized conserved protein YbaA, DUF1428 family n=1 Tax=Colwellia chukchiensis TaxID=641665 RepID=A0A1H7TV20_9GAMM|nr:DUF1428 family protein [Colwellia chukchiensis]SEL88369.1 Uncharacterized conserved protein YbaA, DUF1428 family [Colwellia chukchiensis]
MNHYIDGFVLPISRKALSNYQKLVEAVGAIWLEHGALEYREYLGDDLTLAGTRSFAELVAATQDDVLIFGWVVFPSRAARDAINAKVAADPRMTDLITASQTGFDAKQMAYGGFQPLVQYPNNKDNDQ